MRKYFEIQTWAWMTYLLSASVNAYIAFFPPYRMLEWINFGVLIFALALWEISVRGHQSHLRVMACYAEEERILQVGIRNAYQDMVDTMGEHAAWQRLVAVFGEDQAREIVYGRSS